MKKLPSLKTFLMGTPFFAKEIFSDLLKKGIPVSAVYTMPDRPVGRKKEIIFSEVKKLALEKNIPVRQPEKINAEEISWVREEKPDLIIVAAYGIILPKDLLNVPQFGCLNVHASLLPKFRGPSPIHAAILEEEKNSGTTIMLMDEGVDTGKILSQKKVEVKEKETYQKLEKKIIKASNEILVPTLTNWINKKIKARDQKESDATTTKMISKKDGLIDWNLPVRKIFAKHKAYYEWPKIYSFWQDKKITFNKIEISEEIVQEKKPGKIFEEDDIIKIQTGNGTVIPKIIQIEGKEEMKIKDFVNGKKDFIGSILN